MAPVELPGAAGAVVEFFASYVFIALALAALLDRSEPMALGKVLEGESAVPADPDEGAAGVLLEAEEEPNAPKEVAFEGADETADFDEEGEDEDPGDEEDECEEDGCEEKLPNDFAWATPGTVAKHNASNAVATRPVVCLRSVCTA